MGYYSDVSGNATIDIDKAIEILKKDNVISKNFTATLADSIKSSLGTTDVDDSKENSDKNLLKQVYDDWSHIFVDESYVFHPFSEFVETGNLDGSVYGMKMYAFSDDIKNFVEKYRDAIKDLYAERTGEENLDIEVFEVRNIDGKNVLHIGTPEVTFNFTAVE